MYDSLYDVIIIILGAILGTIFSFVLTQYLFHKKIKLDTINLRDNLINSFRFNLDRINQCIDQVENRNEAPNYLLDTNRINYILFNGKDLFSDESIYNSFNWQRYQLEHINIKLTNYHNLSTNDNTGKDRMKDAYYSLVSHLRQTAKEISELLQSY